MVPLFQKSPRPGRPAVRRVAVATAVIAAHALVLALMCWRPAAPGADAGMNGDVVLASLVDAAPPAARHFPHAARRNRGKPSHVRSETDRDLPPAPADAVSADGSDQPPQLSDAESAALDAFQPALAEGSPGTPCNLTAMIGELLAGSPAVQHGLAEMPSAERSVANAVSLWDGRWPQDSTSGGKELLRAVLAKAVGAARPDCLTIANHGPALFFIPDGGTTAVLAVGSGEWRWGDLVASPAVSTVANNYLDGLASR